MNDRKPEQELPEKVRKALLGYSKAVVFVPPSIDAKVLEQAKAHFGDRKGRIHRLPLPAWAAAAAVMVGLLIWSSPFTRHHPDVADIDGNGAVEIFDAFALARKIEQGAAAKQADINHDGVIDSKDVAIIAQQAVRLPL